MSIKAHMEQERSFRVLSAEMLPALVQAVWGANHALNVDGVTYMLTSAELKRSVHLFSLATEDYFKRRLRIRASRRKLKVVYEEKRLIAEGQKIETVIQEENRPKGVVRMVRNFGPVSSVLAKERLSVSYQSWYGRKSGDPPTIAISIDRLIPFSFQEGGALGPVVYDMDVDGDGNGSENVFVRTDFFKKNIADKVRPLEIGMSKWRLGLTDRPMELNEIQYDQFSARVRAGLALLDVTETAGRKL